MKKISNSLLTVILFLGSLLFAMPVFSQELHPISWTSEVKKVDGNIAEIHIKAKIQDGWNLYDLNVPPGGPLPTVFTFVKSKDYQLFGKMTTTPKSTVTYDDVFTMDIGKWKKTVTFIQRIKVLKTQKFSIETDIEFMMCDENSCIPLSDNLKISVDGTRFEETSAVTDENVTENNDSVKADTSDTTNAKVSIPAGDIAAEKDTKNRSVWFIFWLGLLGGFLALLTPCVWPVIPMTVSFFLNKTQTKRGAVRDAFFYGLSVIVVYVALGLTISLIFGPDALGSLATSPGFNVFFFVLLVVFAIAFFGAFELTLPSKWVNAMDRKTEKSGGFMGVFFMALTLVLVSFSCTGPILGALLVEAASSNSFIAPLMGMLGFSVAMAIPFSLLVIFPSWLKSMPKSGGWMNSVKVVLAFLMLAFAFRFLAVADGVAGWGILPRELFIAIWFVLFLLMGFYLLGKIKMYHDSDVKHMTVGRLFLAMISFVSAALLLPGLWGAPMKAVSGFMPPITTQTFNLNKAVSAGPAVDMSLYEGYHTKEGSYGLIKFLEYEEGMEFAKKQNKPVFLDFTGIGCTNCKKMEASVFGEDKVLPLLRDKYVIIALYVDSRESLPEDKQYVSTNGGKERKIKTVGQKWSDFQSSRYGVNALPYYILLDHNEKMLAEPRAYDTNVDAFAEFLNKGIDNFNKGNQ
jgi:thiol:disulfide interchange protein DsbD